jgi:hypothetical protein
MQTTQASHAEHWLSEIGRVTFRLVSIMSFAVFACRVTEPWLFQSCTTRVFSFILFARPAQE